MNEERAIRLATDSRLLKRSCESLLGIAAGLIADGELNAAEVNFLSVWLSEHREIATSWPGEVVYKRVRDVLSDGVISAEESEYLKKTLTELCGGSFSDDGAVPSESMALPIDYHHAVSLPESSFCFTGTFVYGTRAACERAVEARGGTVSPINRNLNYLVIGELTSRSWKYSSFGTKIESVMKLRAAGAGIAVVSEGQWVRAL